MSQVHSYSFRRKIYELLRQRTEPLTDREIMNALNEHDPNNVRPEITRLKDDEIIRELGKKRCSITGKTVRIVGLTGLPYFEKRARPRPFSSGIPKIQTELFK